TMACRIPGKEEFHEMLRYFRQRIEQTGVILHLGQAATADLLQGYDEVIVATGVRPRDPGIAGQEEGAARGQVLSYVDVLRHERPVGQRVAIVGAGGIGFDVAEFLVQQGTSATLDIDVWRAEWGVVDPAQAPGGLGLAAAGHSSAPARAVTLLQRKPGKLGADLGKTTGWIHRAQLKMKEVAMRSGVNYERIEPRGLLVSQGEKHQDERWIDVDSIVLCAGQEPLRELEAPLRAAGCSVHVIGGALDASGLDAKRAIEQGCRLGARL
ncbi:MAG: NAD(P)/FAD-dependent oxidoreductase, partial [Sterolibacterium sp.]|nr:NAD(P)/FAD-dependent oxidoreductase [Sterolibacterium sp.]